MAHRYTCSLLFLFFSLVAHPQYFKITGKITNSNLEPLALVTVQLKGSTIGVVSKEDGTYELQLEEGDYHIVYSMLGYKAQVINLIVNKDYSQNIILEYDTRDLSEVVVKGKIKDRSEEIIRNVIKHKDELLAAAGPYSCTVYIKATQEDSMPRKRKKQLPDSSRPENLNADISNMSMAEISLQYDHETNSRTREERTGVVKRGDPESLFYLSLTEGDFNLYNNLLRSQTLSVVPFLSPVSYSGLAAYRYKVIATKQQNGRKIYTISVKPRQLSNVTVEGEITILDSAWVILSARFTLPAYHIPEYDHFKIEQQYSYVNDKAWMITQQQFTYFSRHGKGKLSGQTTASYRNFELNKKFPEKYFGMEVSATAEEAYERDSSFWEKTRTEPLNAKEIRFIHYSDSIYRVKHSKPYLDSLDKQINKITWKRVVLSGITRYKREKERTWVLPSVLSMYDLFQFGGARINGSVMYSKTYKSRKNLFVQGNISYGLRNHDINGGIHLNRMYNPFNRGFYSFYADRDFDYIFEGDAWINMVKRSNLYLSNSFGVGHGLELVNGLFLFTDADFDFRRSLSNYKTNRRVDSLLGNILEDNQAIAFDSHNAVYGKIKLQYTPRQRYIREPKEKIILGSKWPTFYISWRKGIRGPLNSKVDFDYLEFGIQQELKLGITGVSKYTILSGSFLSRKDLRLMDYKFQRRGDPLLFMNPNEAFQSLDSTFPVFKRFYQGHYVHEFNGAIVNKIPLLKKLGLRETTGGGFLIAPERNLRYAEAFAGVERVFKWPFNPLYKLKIGFFIIGSVSNQFRNPIQFKIGFTSWDRKRNKWI